uniref:AGC-kinase C-terminal domain-containing protein n=1 Tax=Globodera pallida TaxID=36090 RepID=A0A183BU82_GLOPA
MKTFTRKEFREAPKITDELAADDELMYMPRPYYSRPNRLDKDYFDFDLQHSVDMYREAPLSGHIFTKGPADYRASGTSYLSAALRTPSFWEHRFASIGNQVRQSDPISFESLERLRPRPNKFTTYSDPDFEDYEDPKAADD